MLIDRIRHGNIHQFSQSQEVQFSSAGAVTRIVFDKGFDNIRDGYIRCVSGFTLVGPPCSFTPANNSMGDGLSYAQAIQASSLEVAEGSPPHLALGTRLLWESLDGPRLFQMLDWMSNGVPFIHLSNSNWRLQASGVDQTSEQGFNSVKRKVRRGLLQNQGPVYDSDGAAASTSWTPTWHFAIGRRYGEKLEETAVPLSWLGGECGPCGKGTGSLSVTLSSTIDNNAVTWTTATKGALYIHFVDVPAYRAPAPQLPVIFTRSDNQQIYESKRIHHAWLGILPPLESDGDMPTSSYTRVTSRTGGVEDINPLMSEHLSQMAYLSQSGALGEPGLWDVDTTQQTLTHNARTRLVRWGLPLHLYRGSVFFGPGSLDLPTVLKFETHSETTHHVIDAGWLPLTQSAMDVLPAWSGVPDGMIKSATRNGNRLKDALMRALPARVEGALENAKQAISQRLKR